MEATKSRGESYLFEVEKNHIETALEFYKWNISQTARILEISPTTLRKKISDYKIKKPKK